jgi:DNA-binding SARP family transcriptional activator
MLAQSTNRLCFFGKPALYEKGVLRPFGGPRRAIALLAYMIQHRDALISRESLAELFWPDNDPEDARTALRRHLHRALTALPRSDEEIPWVLGDKNTLRWNPEAPIEVDVTQYGPLVAAGERERAAALYRGDYLEDFYDEWVLAERERLRQVHAANLSALIEERRKALDYRPAIAFAQQLTAMEPLREDAIRRLMALRFAAGDRSGAIADFERFRRRLREELATDPMPETVALREAILRGQSPTLESIASVTTQSARSGFAFVGRDAELQTLRERWAESAHGHGSVVLISGEAGAGKSRLLGELGALVEAQGGRVVTGTTSPIESVPYQPVVEALRHAVPLLQPSRLSAPARAAIATVVHDVPWKGAEPMPLTPVDPQRDRTRLFAAIVAAFEQIAEQRPLALIFEDLQWAGLSTQDLLQVLIPQVCKRAALIVVSVREGDPGEAVAVAMLRRSAPERLAHVALGALSRDAVRELVAISAPALTSKQADEIYVASDGNALFATESLREHMSEQQPSLSSTIAETVKARMTHLSTPARTLLDACAVAGGGFEAETVRATCGWTYAEFYEALDELFDQSLVRESPEHRGQLRFSHQLTHAATYDAIAPDVRRRLHHRVARTLQRRTAAESLEATIARHYDAAGDIQAALGHYLAAAKHAFAVFANSEAVALVDRAIALEPDDRSRFDFLEVRETALRRIGELKRCRDDSAAMIALAQKLRHDDLLGSALCTQIETLMQIGDREAEGRSICELELLGKQTNSARWQLEAAIARARLAIHSADYPDAEAILHSVQHLADEHLAANTLVEYWLIRAHATTRTSIVQARTFIARARASAADDRQLNVRVLRAQAYVDDFLGDPAALDQTAADLLEVYGRIGDLEGQALAHQHLAVTAWYRFDIDAQHRHNALALDLFERLNKRNAIAAVLVNRGVSAQHLGDYDAAQADYRQGEQFARSIGSLELVILAIANRASLETARGNPSAARALAYSALDVASAHRDTNEALAAREYLAEAELQLGNPKGAVQELEPVLERRRGVDPRGVLEALIGIIPAYLGVGDVAAARKAAEELLRLLDAGMRPVFPAHALWTAAAAYAASGDVEGAAQLRGRARALLDENCSKLRDERTRAGYRSLAIHRQLIERPATS